jgi:seryl-tRNA synthetase
MSIKEIFSFTTEENSEKEHLYLRETIEIILIELGLHYNIVLLAAQDCSFASACTYDIEIYLPGHGIYKEVSSISNCRDYQARRSNTRYRYLDSKKSCYFHTLNGSSLAIPRLLIALLETYQTPLGECDFNSIYSLIDKIEKKYSI